MVKAKDAIRTARSLIGTPYSKVDCIRLIVLAIRNSPGGVPGYRCQGTNWLWRSIDNSGKYKDLTWRGEAASSTPRAGMLAFQRKGDDIHHVGLITDSGTVIHSSSVRGEVVETALDKKWTLLGIHRYISPAESGEVTEDEGEKEEAEEMQPYTAQVKLNDPDSSLTVRDAPDGTRIGRIGHGAMVRVISERDGWAFVQFGDDGSGYVSADYLAPVVDEPAPEAPKITIIDSAGRRFEPDGDWRVLIGSLD